MKLIRKIIEKILGKELKLALEQIHDKRWEAVCEIDSYVKYSSDRVLYIHSEQFLDDLVERLRRKQL